MSQGTTLLAEKTTLLWFATVSRTVLDALRDPSSAAGKEILSLGISADALREASTIVRDGGLTPLEAVHGMYRDRFCSPPPCGLNHGRIGDVVAVVKAILEPAPPGEGT